MKKLIAVVLIVIMVLTMASCNYQFFDTKYNYDSYNFIGSSGYY